MPTEIHQEVTFEAKPKDVYEALMDTKKHTAFTKNSAAKISKKVGGAFSAYGGYISGINLELVENKRIVQSWRAKNWPKGLYSIVSFRFEKVGTGTKLTFDHTGLPAPERAISDRAMQAIDNLAGQITGNPQYFWMGSASAGGNQLAYERALAKDARRRRLMGVRIPVMAVRMNLI